jgi:hypothetical protein
MQRMTDGLGRVRAVQTGRTALARGRRRVHRRRGGRGEGGAVAGVGAATAAAVVAAVE